MDEPRLTGADLPPGTMEVAAIRGLQGVTEASVKSQIRTELDQVGLSTRGHLNAFTGKISESKTVQILGYVLRGGTGAVDASWKALRDSYRDGQEALKRSIALLSPLEDYGAAYCDWQGGFWKYSQNYGLIHFNNQLGPMKGCRLDGGKIVLEDKGLWDIKATLTIGGNAIGVGSGRFSWEVRVYKPDGGVYSKQVSHTDSVARHTATISTAVVVPGPGYSVGVEIAWIHGSREIYGGPANARLIVHHITDQTTQQGVDVGTGAEDSYEPDMPDATGASNTPDAPVDEGGS